MSKTPSHPPQPKRAQRSQTAARKRGKQDAEHQMYRAKLMQQWQRASMLLAVSLMTMMVAVPFVALVVAGSLGLKLGIPQKYAALWLVILIAGWFASFVLSIFSVWTRPTMAKRSRTFWLVVFIVPASTVPAAAAYAYLRREELQDDVFAEGEPPRRKWWSW
jgi:FtsH-binding integral membrane protein